MSHGLFMRVHRLGQFYWNRKSRLLRGANAGTLSNKNPENKRRDLILLSALIEYPGVGLILFETGCAEDLDVVREKLYPVVQFAFHSANTGT